jgi:radical SAM superfamily enzyme YgiQ (UPF0313 family)
MLVGDARAAGSDHIELAKRAVNICIVRPPTLTSVGAVGQDAVPPIGPAYITGALEAAGHHVTVVDAVGNALDQYTRLNGYKHVLIHGLTEDQIAERIPNNTEVIGISSMFSVEWPITKKVIDRIRQAFPEAMIVLGGEHITAAPDFSMESCRAIDVAVLGEGEATIVDLLSAITYGRNLSTVKGIVYRSHEGLQRTPIRPRIRDVDSIAAPSWSLWPVEEYIERELTHGINLGRCMPILASRGCPYQCTFCSSPQMWTTLWRARDPELVVAEMKHYMRTYKATNFDFYDLTAIVKKSWIIDFCNVLEREKLDITWQLPSGTRSEAIDEAVVELLYRSGCRSMNYAPETGSPEELDRIKKRCKLDRMLESMKAAHKAGVEIKVNFIFGLPGGTWKDVRKTFKFFAQLAWVGVDDVACFPYSPYPGTELFNDLVKCGRITVNEDYFISLLGYTDISNSVSYSDFITSRQLSALNIAGMAFFYALNFLFRPWRAAEFVFDAVTRRTSSKLTMALSNTRRKRKANKLFTDDCQTVVIQR